jgi:hypothetical protein
MSYEHAFGVTLASISSSLVLLSRHQLGTSFTFTPQAKGLVFYEADI